MDPGLSIIGIDIGGTKTAVVEGTFDGEILKRAEFPTEAERPFTVTWPVLRHHIRKAIRDARASGRTVSAVSISVGGPLEIASGRLIDPPHLPGWHGVELRETIMAAFPAVPVHVEHDGNAGALAELYFGIGRSEPDLRHLVFLTFGTGLGAGIIVNGDVLHGATDSAGEVGHWRLVEEGPVGFGKAGSWEGLASGRGLVNLASKMHPDRWTPQTSISSLVDAMLRDDPDALEVAREAGRWMGRGIALLVDALNPQVVVLGSLAVVLRDRVLAAARETVRNESLPQAAAACRIVPAVLGKRIGDTASLMAAIHHVRRKNPT